MAQKSLSQIHCKNYLNWNTIGSITFFIIGASKNKYILKFIAYGKASCGLVVLLGAPTLDHYIDVFGFKLGIQAYAMNGVWTTSSGNPQFSYNNFSIIDDENLAEILFNYASNFLCFVSMGYSFNLINLLEDCDNQFPSFHWKVKIAQEGELFLEMN